VMNLFSFLRDSREPLLFFRVRAVGLGPPPFFVTCLVTWVIVIFFSLSATYLPAPSNPDPPPLSVLLSPREGYVFFSLKVIS